MADQQQDSEGLANDDYGDDVLEQRTMPFVQVQSSTPDLEGLFSLRWQPKDAAHRQRFRDELRAFAEQVRAPLEAALVAEREAHSACFVSLGGKVEEVEAALEAEKAAHATTRIHWNGALEGEQKNLELLRAAEAQLAALSAENMRLGEELTDYVLYADGIKHHYRCSNNMASGGGDGHTICLRCQRDESQAQFAALQAAVREKLEEAWDDGRVWGRRDSVPGPAHRDVKSVKMACLDRLLAAPEPPQEVPR